MAKALFTRKKDDSDKRDENEPLLVAKLPLVWSSSLWNWLSIIQLPSGIWKWQTWTSGAEQNGLEGNCELMAGLLKIQFLGCISKSSKKFSISSVKLKPVACRWSPNQRNLGNDHLINGLHLWDQLQLKRYYNSSGGTYRCFFLHHNFFFSMPYLVVPGLRLLLRESQRLVTFRNKILWPLVGTKIP